MAIVIQHFNRTSNNISSLIPQFDRSKSQFKFNENYNLNGGNEANTYLQIYKEICFLHGSDVIFLPRTPNNPEPIFGEYLASTLESGYPMRLILEDNTGWDGSGDLYSKFGLSLSDSTTFHCPKILFDDIMQPKINNFQIGNSTIVDELVSPYPKPGDLIYYVNGKKLFEIQHIEDESQPGFYVFGNRQSYVIKCKVYTFDHMEISETASSIPFNISSLNDIAEQDETRFNEEIINVVATESIIDNSERDPLTGR